MADKSKRATLNVTAEFKEELDKMKKANESYEEILKREIFGYKRELDKNNVPIAFKLSGEYMDGSYETVYVNWHELFKSKVGDFWSVSDREDCINHNSASIIYKDDDLVLVKFKAYFIHNGKRHDDVNLESFTFISQ